MKDNKRILIVDDEPEICEIIYLILEPYYEEIEFYCDSKIASEKILNGHYDLILSDVMMPGLLGPDLVRLVRSGGNLSPIMFITGQASRESLLSAIRLGVSDIIEKPFDAEVLLTSARRSIEIEKRKFDLARSKFEAKLTTEQIKQKQKLVGLFIVSSEKLKAS